MSLPGDALKPQGPLKRACEDEREAQTKRTRADQELDKQREDQALACRRFL